MCLAISVHIALSWSSFCRQMFRILLFSPWALKRCVVRYFGLCIMFLQLISCRRIWLCICHGDWENKICRFDAQSGAGWSNDGEELVGYLVQKRRRRRGVTFVCADAGRTAIDDRTTTRTTVEQSRQFIVLDAIVQLPLVGILSLGETVARGVYRCFSRMR